MVLAQQINCFLIPDAMIEEFKEVTLKHSIEAHDVHLPAGARGVVMAAYASGEAARGRVRMAAACRAHAVRRSARGLGAVIRGAVPVKVGSFRQSVVTDCLVVDESKSSYFPAQNSCCQDG